MIGMMEGSTLPDVEEDPLPEPVAEELPLFEVTLELDGLLPPRLMLGLGLEVQRTRFPSLILILRRLKLLGAPARLKVAVLRLPLATKVPEIVLPVWTILDPFAWRSNASTDVAPQALSTLTANSDLFCPIFIFLKHLAYPHPTGNRGAPSRRLAAHSLLEHVASQGATPLLPLEAASM